MDFSGEDRAKMFDYTVEKYGKDHCAKVSTFQMRKAKAAIRDTARILNIDYDIANSIAKLVPTTFYDDDGEKQMDLPIAKALEVSKELAEAAEEYPELFEKAQRLEGLPSSPSLHPAGILISPVSLDGKIPLIESNKENLLATSVNLEDAEAAGLIKMDYLSLASLSVYEKTQQDVGFIFDYDHNTYDDEKVWNLIGSRYTTGLFQISSKTYKSRMPRLKPKTIHELAACLALVRGPCISSKMDQLYMEILEGKKQVDEIHPLYYEATKDTLGILLTQEQLMQVAVNFGFTIDESYAIMKAIAKKKPEVIQKYRTNFMEKANERNVDPETANKIFQVFVDCGQYSFNLSHAISYALLCYCSAYLKTYYPKEFLCNLLTNAYERKKKEEITEILEDCRRLGIKFLPLDVNQSSWDFSLEEEGLRIGICAIKGFGKIAYDEINSNRPFVSFADVIDRTEKGKCSKRNMIPAIFAGLFDCFNTNRQQMYFDYMELRKEDPLDKIKLQSKEEFVTDATLEVLEEILLGGRLLSDDTNKLQPSKFHEVKAKKIFQAEVLIRSIKQHKDARQRKMAFLTLMAGDGSFECTVFNDVYNKVSQYLKKNNIVTIKARKENNGCILQDIL